MNLKQTKNTHTIISKKFIKTSKSPQKQKKAPMAFPIPRATLSWVSSFRPSSLSHLLPISLSPQTHSLPPMRASHLFASLSTTTTAHEPPFPPTVPSYKGSNNRWKPMCLYYTQGKCTKVSLSHNPPTPSLLNLIFLLHLMFYLFL
jgi:hypothetical protein